MNTEEFPGLSFSRVTTNELGLEVGVLTLNRPATLNALNEAMVLGIKTQLERWAKDNSIELILIKGNGARAYCAGGDIKTLYEAGSVDFLADEYRLDEALYRYPKPIVHLLHGYVMGGGMGLMASGSLRLCLPETEFAMPEVAIGFFPDVGYRYHLAQLPLGLGAWLGLTAARFGTPLAMALGIVDHVLPFKDYDVLFAKVSERIAQWSQRQGPLLDCLQTFAISAGSPAPIGPVPIALDAIQALVPPEILQWCKGFWDCTDRPWIDDLTHLAAKFEKKPANAQSAMSPVPLSQLSPLSIAVASILLKRAVKQPLTQVFDEDYWVAAQLYATGDLREGILAKVIERRPAKWRYSFAAVLGGNQVNAEITAEFNPPTNLPTLFTNPIRWSF